MTTRQLEASDPGPGHIDNSVCCEALCASAFQVESFRGGLDLIMCCDLNQVPREETLRGPWAGNQEPAPRPAQSGREQKAQPALG